MTDEQNLTDEAAEPSNSERRNRDDVPDSPTPNADEAVDAQEGSQLETNSQADVIETEDAG